MTSQERNVREELSSALVGIHFAPVEKKILYILADGQPHLIDDLVPLLNDTQSTRSNVSAHITNIRRKLRPVHHHIVCINKKRRSYYQYVILLTWLSFDAESN